MTIQRRMEANLRNYGMVDREEIEAVIDLAKRMGLTSTGWESDTDANRELSELLWVNVRLIARDYLAEHNPTATYRRFFEDQE